MKNFSVINNGQNSLFALPAKIGQRNNFIFRRGSGQLACIYLLAQIHALFNVSAQRQTFDRLPKSSSTGLKLRFGQRAVAGENIMSLHPDL